MQGFHELIPADLVNVFDERELELLIGGIADIDVDDWKKHTDYRGYTESDPVVQNFWKVCGMLRSVHYEYKANNCNYRSSAAGTPSRSPVSYNSPPVLRVSPSTVSKIFKVPTDRVVSRSRSLAKSRNFPSRIRASTVWICLLTRPTKCSRRSSHGLSRRLSASDRSKKEKVMHAGQRKLGCRRYLAKTNSPHQPAVLARTYVLQD